VTRNPWAAYWAKSGGAAGAGCLPEAAPAVAAVIEAAWRDFAARLRPKARVLDLATGSGAVPRALKAARRDLDLVGVDSAPELPAGPPGIRLVGGVAIEQLPFGDASFDAATSQFGLEYGDRGRAVAEAARVLRSGGTIRLVVHHQESGIVRHNRGRREALHWATRGSPMLDKARRLALARAAAPLPTPAAFREAVAEAQRAWPEQPVAAEIMAAIVQTLDMGRTRPPRETIEVLDSLAARAADEAGRIEALLAAACDEAEAAAIGGRLRDSGLEVDRLEALNEPSGAPLAWLIDASRPA
jgi:ubiquinone/menaquinone biosynthesis C-methylase UbiE